MVIPYACELIYVDVKKYQHCHKQISGFCDNCYKRYETKYEAIMAFGAHMKGGIYEQKVEHGVFKQKAEVLKREKGRNPITFGMIVIAIQFVIIVGLCYVVLRLID